MTGISAINMIRRMSIGAGASYKNVISECNKKVSVCAGAEQSRVELKEKVERWEGGREGGGGGGWW